MNSERAGGTPNSAAGWNVPFEYGYKTPNFASHIRTAFANMVLKDSLQLAGRTIDDLQYLGSCSLLLECLVALAGKPCKVVCRGTG